MAATLPKTIKKVRIENYALTESNWRSKTMLPYEMGVVLNNDGIGIDRVFFNSSSENKKASDIYNKEAYCLYSKKGAHLPIAEAGKDDPISGKLGGVIPHSTYFQVNEEGYMRSNLFTVRGETLETTESVPNLSVTGSLTANDITINQVESIQSPNKVIKLNVSNTTTIGSQSATAYDNTLVIYGAFTRDNIVKVISDDNGREVEFTGVTNIAAGDYGILTKITGEGFINDNQYTVSYQQTLPGGSMLTTKNEYVGMHFCNINSSGKDIILGVSGSQMPFMQIEDGNRRKILTIDESSEQGVIMNYGNVFSTAQVKTPSTIKIQSLEAKSSVDAGAITARWEAGACLKVEDRTASTNDISITYSHNLISLSSLTISDPTYLISSIITDGYGHIKTYHQTSVNTLKQAIQDSLESQISTNTNNITSLTGRVTTLESTVTTLNSTLNDHTTALNALDSAAKWTDGASKTGIIIGNSSTIYGSTYDISNQALAAVSDPAKKIPTVSQVTAYVLDKIIEGAEGIEVDISSMQNRIDILENKIDNIKVINSIRGDEEYIKSERDEYDNVVISHINKVPTTSTDEDDITVTSESSSFQILSNISCDKGHVSGITLKNVNLSNLFTAIASTEYTSGSDAIIVDNDTRKISHKQIPESRDGNKEIVVTTEGSPGFYIPSNWDTYGHVLEQTYYTFKTDAAVYNAGDGITINTSTNTISATPYTAADDTITINDHEIQLAEEYVTKITTLEEENKSLKNEIYRSETVKISGWTCLPVIPDSSGSGGSGSGLITYAASTNSYRCSGTLENVKGFKNITSLPCSLSTTEYNAEEKTISFVGYSSTQIKNTSSNPLKATYTYNVIDYLINELTDLSSEVTTLSDELTELKNKS